MKPEYLKKLELLEREVQDFHPVLRQLFSRLPSVTHVEYKQGPNEKGADFVIIKRDDALDEETYIGVICKVGKITQSHAEIERQIDECKIYPRLIQSGGKNIFLNEVWVVSNSTISANAEEKIHHKFKGSNIRFLNGEKIATLISKHYPDFWDFDSVNYGQYFSQTLLSLSSSSDSSFFGSLGISEFLDQSIIKESGKKSKNRPQKLSTVISSERFLFLEGSVGSGKSTLLRQLIEKIKVDIESNTEKSTLPIIYQYSDVIKNQNDIENLIKLRCQEFHLPLDHDIIFIIDSIDEVNEGLESRLENFKVIVEKVSKINNVKLLVTSRNMDSLQDYEVIDKLFTRYSIRPLSIGQIIKFVDKICNNIDITKKLKNGIEKTPLFKFIPRTPISAILLARILNDEIKELPSTMTELYSKYTEIVLGRWDTSKGLMSQTEYDIVSNVLMDISKFMMDNSLTHISVTEIQDIYLDYISQRNLNVDEDKVFSRLLNRSEVAFVNESNNTFSFIHRSFMEYFYAEKIKKSDLACIDEKIYDVYWANSYFFYFGLLRDSEKCLDLLNEIKATSDKTRFLRLFYNGSFLLAAYLTPYNKIKNGVLNAFIDAGKLYEDILRANTDIPLKNFSPVALLCVFTKCLSNNYSYDFFKVALRDAVIDIDKQPEIGEHINYSKFFLCSCLNELGDKTSFDEMLKNNNLDILVQLGIRHVIDDTGLISQNADRYIKKTNKKIKGNKGLQEYIRSLYDKSTEELEEEKNKKLNKKDH
jgi:energy-coupling factor transporter ATP-binding protein EcfA2